VAWVTPVDFLVDMPIISGGVHSLSPENTTNGMRTHAAVASGVMIWVKPRSQATDATPMIPLMVSRHHMQQGTSRL